PHIVGTSTVGMTVQLVDAQGHVLGSTGPLTQASFTLQPAANLPFGRNALSVRAVDAAGNVGTPRSLSLLILKTDGDYDADGRAGLRVCRGTTGEWFMLLSGGGGTAVRFGAADVDVPVPGDYDGDGKADLAVFRKTTAQWFVIQSTAGPKGQSFGAANLD